MAKPASFDELENAIQNVLNSENESFLEAANILGLDILTDFSNADLHDIDLQNLNLCGADFHESNLSGVNFYGCNLSNSNLTKTCLKGANLCECNLKGADLRDADLSETNLSRANLRNANLSGANLRNAELRYANLDYANLENATLNGAIIENSKLDLSIGQFAVMDNSQKKLFSTHTQTSWHKTIATSQSLKSKGVAPVVLVILSGWGYREETDGNAIASANARVLDTLWNLYPSTLIQASGKAVGLPKGQMGNSEVSHLTIGAGRIVPQEIVRISDFAEEGKFSENAALVNVCQSVSQRQSKLHLIGLCSQGGVHSHLSHLFALLKLAKQQGVTEVCVHAILDGRDTSPINGVDEIQRLQAKMTHTGVGRIVTLSGRYYAMDPDRCWDRVQLVYDVMTRNENIQTFEALDLLRTFYIVGRTDEFIPPTRIASGAIEPNDGVIFFNFRPDRARQLTQAFVDPNFNGFERTLIQPVEVVTFTQYDPSLAVKVAFEPQNLSNVLGEVIAQRGLKQFRVAETEKYAHVTYFFNGGLEDPLEGEDRELIQSPMVASYDKALTMAAREVTDAAIKAIQKQVYSLVVINYANTDMVGHTGNMDATIKAVNAVDDCIGKLVDAVGKAGGTTLITADHGNAELMWDQQHHPWTGHTTNPVPFILIEGKKRKIPGFGTEVRLRTNGCLADIAPTILEILQLPQPAEMTGESLTFTKHVDVQSNKTNKKTNRIWR
jgi:2,3-bisphosphoglycerate-independent phosphoglycerate mutase